jgi:lipoprotein-releasing system permease protein
MYKLLLCWRYLRTRYIALASIISVTLGVATMIVVNSVMEGFSVEMQCRMQGILSDVVVESHSAGGFYDPDRLMADIERVIGDDIEAMTPTVHVPAMLSYRYGESWMTHPVQLIGIDAETQSQASDFGKYLLHPQNREQMSFDLREGGYDTRQADAGAESPDRSELASAGWQHRRMRYRRERQHREWLEQAAASDQAAENERQGPIREAHRRGAATSAAANGVIQAQAVVDTVEPPTASPIPVADVPAATELAASGSAVNDPVAAPDDPFATIAPMINEYDPEKETSPGAVVGIALASYRIPDGREMFLARPGDDIKLTFPNAGTPPRAVDTRFTVVDFYESKMSEYDSQLVFVPLGDLQRLRGMIEEETGIGYANTIQIKLRPGVDANKVRNRLGRAFPPQSLAVSTWRDKQGPLLAAVEMETRILNVLLFMIIAVAGFGILAIFYMIVVEKTRDIGVLKSLGASSRGVMGIFVGYGVSLGVVGSGAGAILGLLFVYYINDLATLIGKVTGQEVFDPSIYYFYKIPTIVNPWTVSWIVAGAILIAVMASILPARRAARQHPVEALRV